MEWQWSPGFTQRICDGGNATRFWLINRRPAGLRHFSGPTGGANANTKSPWSYVVLKGAPQWTVPLRKSPELFGPEASILYRLTFWFNFCCFVVLVRSIHTIYMSHSLWYLLQVFCVYVYIYICMYILVYLTPLLMTAEVHKPFLWCIVVHFLHFSPLCTTTFR